jgi:hypothetical protein
MKAVGHQRQFKDRRYIKRGPLRGASAEGFSSSQGEVNLRRNVSPAVETETPLISGGNNPESACSLCFLASNL